MLSICDQKLNHTCAGYGRRDFLKIGSLGLGGLTLPGLLAANASGATTPDYLTGKSVVLLFLQGGPPHIEFFDPKMTAPSEFHSITGEIQTKTPGITFGSTFPKLASMTDKFSIVRSYGSKNSGHTYLDVASGRNEMKATMSSIYARVAGVNNPFTGMPNNVLIKPEAITTGLKLGSNFETGALPTLTDPGTLGASFRAFDPSGGGPLQQNMQLSVTPERLTDRRYLLENVDRLRRQADTTGVIDGANKFQQQAFDVITGGVAEAFDLGKESDATLKRYDTSSIFDMKDLNRWGDMRRTTNLLGKQMLLARRLCEAGCGFVTVSDCGWDYHANNNSPKGMTGIYPMGNQVDHAVSAFIEDVHARGLQDDVLLVVTGEMGRSPRINGGGGRDHYGELTPLLLSGGGLKMGKVVGQSDSQAAKPATVPYDPSHMLGTVLHTLFDIGVLRVTRGIPSDLIRTAENAKLIDPLI